MAYMDNNEFPHFSPDKINLNWILEQYATFNARIKEILDRFDEKAEEMQAEVNQIVSDFETFKNLINENFENFETNIREEVAEGLASVENQIDTISVNMQSYISGHMDEWQAEASYSNNILKLSNELSPEEANDQGIEKIQIDGKLHKTSLPKPLNSIYVIDNIISNDRIPHNGVVLYGKGTFIIFLSATLNIGNPIHAEEISISLRGASGTSLNWLSINSFNFDEESEKEIVLNTACVVTNNTDSNALIDVLIGSSLNYREDVSYTISAVPLRVGDVFNHVISN